MHARDQTTPPKTQPNRRSLLGAIKEWLKEKRSVVWMQAFIKRWRNRAHSHDAIYDTAYFDMVDRTSGNSAINMAKTIDEQFAPMSVLDVGCGAGNLLDELRGLGIRVLGLEYATAAIGKCHEKRVGCDSIRSQKRTSYQAVLRLF